MQQPLTTALLAWIFVSTVNASKCYYNSEGKYTCNGVTFGITKRVGLGIGLGFGGLAAIIAIGACFIHGRGSRTSRTDDAEKNISTISAPLSPARPETFSRRQSSAFRQIADSPTVSPVYAETNVDDNGPASRVETARASNEGREFPRFKSSESPFAASPDHDNLLQALRIHESNRRSFSGLPSSLATAHLPTPNNKVQRSSSSPAIPSPDVISFSSSHSSSRIPHLPPHSFAHPNVVVTPPAPTNRQNSGNSSLGHDSLPPYEAHIVPKFNLS